MSLCAGEGEVQHLATNVVKKDVDEVLRGGSELRREVFIFVVQGSFTAHFFEPGDFVGAAGDSDDSATLEKGNLHAD